MQWSPVENGGFTKGNPWLPIAMDFREINVDSERNDDHSLLTLYRRLIELRRGEPALEVGSFEPVAAEGDVLAYIRRTSTAEREFLIALNLGSQPGVLRRSDSALGTIEFSTYLDRSGERFEADLPLRPDEGLLIRLD
jgi:alpha-glucosidase